MNLLVNPQHRSLKGILCLFIRPYNAGTRDSEDFFNPDITNALVTINGIPNRVYNNGIKAYDQWREIRRLFRTDSGKIRCGDNFYPYMSPLSRQHVRVLSRSSIHGWFQHARQRPAPCKLRKRGANRPYKNHLRLRNCEMPHLQHQ